MIGKNVYILCSEDLSKIENYNLAINDETQIWHLHHRLETHFSNGDERPANARISMKELIELGMYFHRPAEELIFLTKSKHMSIHKAGQTFNHKEKTKEKIGKSNKGKLKGKHISESHKRHISESTKGKKLSKDHKQKISKALKNRQFTEEHRRRISEANTGHKASVETRQKLSRRLKGLKRSEETKDRMSQAAKERWAKWRKNHDTINAQ